MLFNGFVKGFKQGLLWIFMFVDFIAIWELNTLTWVSVVIIIFAAICASIWICWQKRKGHLMQQRRRIEQIPSIVSTLGVLGTFLGITIGLLHFNSNNLTASIPELLDGLKTAFFTSLAGMSCSMILSYFISHLFDKDDNGVSDINVAAGQITKAIQTMSNAIAQQTQQQSQVQAAFYNNITTLLNQVNNNHGVIITHCENMLTAINQMAILITTNSNHFTKIVEMITETNASLASITASVGNIEDIDKQIETYSSTQITEFGRVYNIIGEVADHTETTASIGQSVADNIVKLGDRIHGEVVEIEENMAKTNILLNDKFQEFSELLKKSNTEALVEVMKQVTEEFQKQMNALINKLIQENFDQLNKSVERLNIWQQENKEMISRLTTQYQQMADNFEDTSISLSKVDEDTKQLVSEGGKLHQIIEALNKVIVEDEKFIQVSTKLQETATLTQSNMETFDTSTKALNDWVKKQRNFVDGVVLLIQKLEEISKIKDYGEQFWNETKQKMEEGVGIIANGTNSLNTQITGLNQQFYQRLSTTLAQLDSCIQAMINGKTNK